MTHQGAGRARTTRSYLDHAASAPLAPAAREAWLRAAGVVGNPASLHGSGRAARAVLEDAREQLAEAVGAHPTEVLFTSGGSEADAIALSAGTRRPARRGVLVGATEHPAVATAVERLDGVTRLRCDSDGRVDLAHLAEVLDGRTALVSVMAVNNETGTVQPLPEVVERAHRHGAWAHSDAVQALGHVRFDFGDARLDLASLSGHKVGAPVGIGALLVRRGVELGPHGLGGGQESGVRSGTQPVALAAAFAAAAQQAVAQQEHEATRLAGLRTRLVAGVLAGVAGSELNGGGAVAPHIANLTFRGTRADDVLMLLDAEGIDCSTGSACRAGVHQPSEVLLAMGRDLSGASASVRFSLGTTTTEQEVERLLAVLPGVVARARSAHG